MKIGLVVALFWLGPAVLLAGDQTLEESSAQQKIERVIMFFYNHMDILDKNTEAKLAAEELIQKYPDNPWLYDLWAAMEWNAMGLELGIKIDERQSILDNPAHRQRAQKYHQMVERGLQLAELTLANASQSHLEERQWLFAKAVLHFAYGKFAVRFENRLRQSDEAGAKGIKELKKILARDPDFGPAFMYLGGTRHQLAVRGMFQRLGIRLFSFTYKELEELCDSVFDKEESIAWIEKAGQYGAPEPWLKKNWLEALLSLEGIYNRRRKDFDAQEELVFIAQKYRPLLELLADTLPENIKYAQKLEQLKEDVRIKQAH